MLAHYPEKYSVKARATRKFAVIDVIAHAPDAFNAFKVYLNLNCSYCSEIVLKQLQARNCHIMSAYSTVANVTTIQFCDFENIEWENVMNGSEVASSYLVRKGECTHRGSLYNAYFNSILDTNACRHYEHIPRVVS